VRGEPPEKSDSIGFVTLAVTPEQAQALFLAQKEATLTIVLRPFGDDAEVALAPFLEPFVIE
jgi:Flp pilus assembly protein CpaB